jgi:hypothetical protein
MKVEVAVEWEHGFKHSYEYDYATPKWIEQTKKRYAEMTWVKKVVIKEKKK